MFSWTPSSNDRRPAVDLSKRRTNIPSASSFGLLNILKMPFKSQWISRAQPSSVLAFESYFFTVRALVLF